MSFAEQMIQAIQEERLNEAEKFFNRSLEQDSTTDLYLLADTLYQLGFLKETKRVAEHLLSQNPIDDELRIQLAEIAIEEGEDGEAIEYLQEINQSSPAYPQALLVSADYYTLQELPEVSEIKLKEAKELLPEEPVITFALAELHFTMGKYAQAIREYEELLEKGQEEVAGILLSARLGSAYSALGDWENAVGYLEEALETKEDVDTIFQLGFTYFQQEEYQRANELFHQVKTMDHTYTSVYPYLAKGLEEEQELDRAEETVEEGLQQDKTNYQLFLIAASISIKQGKEEQAEKYYKEAMDIDPENEAISIQYTNFLLYQGRFEEAIDVIQHALNELDADPQFYWNLAIAQNELEEFDAASKAYEKAYPNFDNNPDFLKQYFLFLQEEGQTEKMKEVGKKYLELNPNDIEIQGFMNRQDDDWI
jgi:tetratricopeptide (TPR) repeat protein